MTWHTTKEEQREYYRKYRAAHRDKINASNRKYYYAHREENKEKHRQNSKNYRDNNKEKVSEANRIWRANNHDYNIQRLREWHQEHRLEGLIYSRNYRALYSEECKQKNKAYRKNNPDKVRYWTRLYRTRKLSSPGRGITAAQERELFEEYNYRCAYCGRSDVQIEIDHIEPLIDGGLHDIENATVACHSCNASKQDKTLLRFLYDRLQKGS